MPTSQPGSTDFLQSKRMDKAGNAGFCPVAVMSVFRPNRAGVVGKALRSRWIFIQFLVNVRGNFSSALALRRGAPLLSNISPQSEFSQQAPKGPRMQFSGRLRSAFGGGVVWVWERCLWVEGKRSDFGFPSGLLLRTYVPWCVECKQLSVVS